MRVNAKQATETDSSARQMLGMKGAKDQPLETNIWKIRVQLTKPVTWIPLIWGESFRGSGMLVSTAVWMRKDPSSSLATNGCLTQDRLEPSRRIALFDPQDSSCSCPASPLHLQVSPVEPLPRATMSGTTPSRSHSCLLA